MFNKMAYRMFIKEHPWRRLLERHEGTVSIGDRWELAEDHVQLLALVLL
jgi:hypothetical protein